MSETLLNPEPGADIEASGSTASGASSGTSAGPAEVASGPFAALPNILDLGAGEACGPDGC